MRAGPGGIVRRWHGVLGAYRSQRREAKVLIMQYSREGLRFAAVSLSQLKRGISFNDGVGGGHVVGSEIRMRQADLGRSQDLGSGSHLEILIDSNQIKLVYRALYEIRAELVRISDHHMKFRNAPWALSDFAFGELWNSRLQVASMDILQKEVTWVQISFSV